MESLKTRYKDTGLWESFSPRRVGERGRQLLSPGLMEEIAALSRKNPSPDRVIRRLGVKHLSSLAIEKGVSLEEILAAVGIYLEELSSGK